MLHKNVYILFHRTPTSDCYEKQLSNKRKTVLHCNCSQEYNNTLICLSVM